MVEFPKKLKEKLLARTGDKTLRSLPERNTLVDFSSNDYLGLSRNGEIFERASQILSEKHIVQNGSTGSRLLSGNHPLYTELEEKLAEFHQTESALVFNSGYDANIGFFGAVPQRGDIVFYDEYIHASIRDGIKMGNAKSYKFKHNDLGDLKKREQAERRRSLFGTKEKRGQAERKLPKTELRPSRLIPGKAGEAEVPLPNTAEVYVVTESVFSMDGDSPDLKAFAEFCQENKYHLVVDEAHAIGVFGKCGEGLVQELGLQHTIFARIVTFGKAMGCHGAAILGSIILKNYLVNFARSLIYTTGLPPHSVATITASYEYLLMSDNAADGTPRHRIVRDLSEKIKHFNFELETPALSTSNAPSIGNVKGGDLTSPAGVLKPIFIPSTSAIHCCIIPGNERVKKIAEKIREKGFDVRPILSPTVPKGQERLRICLHTFNTEKEISEVLQLLAIFTKEA
ncbi:8-amino-7-oxononanoate synthase [Pricia antarctica]|uniref:8-amino-7-oxononanoate synthase n=1 Tax=Pricia antarctica TaxID=641691 RepID=A0A1G6W4I1_9FLAO|nr:pyridoxal phosphate-dependent aminotransferase family protein [Pricia antarctica]SDD60749.1 8-amino-7-oxononanoate synthase [Pricia antarctica]